MNWKLIILGVLGSAASGAAGGLAAGPWGIVAGALVGAGTFCAGLYHPTPATIVGPAK